MKNRDGAVRVHGHLAKNNGLIYCRIDPERAAVMDEINKKIDSIELYPASEGFIAYQDSQHAEGMLMVLNSGIFFEFIPAEEYFTESPRRLTIEEVELGKNYALIINNNADVKCLMRPVTNSR